MCPHPDNGLARASDPLNAHLGQEQRLTLQGGPGSSRKAPHSLDLPHAHGSGILSCVFCHVGHRTSVATSRWLT
jgi:hypothetical protein